MYIFKFTVYVISVENSGKCRNVFNAYEKKFLSSMLWNTYDIEWRDALEQLDNREPLVFICFMKSRQDDDLEKVYEAMDNTGNNV